MSASGISIIIPAFNVAPYVGAALESVLQQTEKPHEILVYNDGSTDETASVLAQYAKNTNIRYYSHDNMGLGLTRNLGAQQATGDYLYFFDSDDLLDKNFISRMHELIREYASPDLLMFSGESFTEDDKFSGHVHGESYRRGFSSHRISGLEALASMARSYVIPSASLYVVKASFWREHDFNFPATLHEDDEVIIPLLVSSKSVVVKDEVYFYRRFRKNSIMTKPRDSHYLAGLESSLRQALKQLDLVPRSARTCRKLTRKRCRNIAREYVAVCRELHYSQQRKLLLDATIKTRNGRALLRSFDFIERYLYQKK